MLDMGLYWNTQAQIVSLLCCAGLSEGLYDGILAHIQLFWPGFFYQSHPGGYIWWMGPKTGPKSTLMGTFSWSKGVHWAPLTTMARQPAPLGLVAAFPNF